MKRTILYPLLTLYLLIFSNGQAIASGNDSIRLSLLTCAPGEEIYSLFGHTAIRYEDPANGIDAVFNYGLFSFNTPNFILRFSLGETDYQLGATDYARFAAEYAFDGRSVWQQTLNLSKKKRNSSDYCKKTIFPKTEFTGIISFMTTALHARAIK